jgi:hypothetical protein
MEMTMKPLRYYVVNFAAGIGLIALGLTLLSLTGFLFHILTPRTITIMIASTANMIYRSTGAWWLTMLIGWAIFAWSMWVLISHRAEKPLLVREDELGTVEVTPTAVAGLAKAEAVNLGAARPVRTEYVRKFGRPVIQLWCDLTRNDGGEGPLVQGEKLKREVEKRIREEFSLENVRVEVIHKSSSKAVVRAKPLEAA